jgi:hypothetical protein
MLHYLYPTLSILYFFVPLLALAIFSWWKGKQTRLRDTWWYWLANFFSVLTFAALCLMIVGPWKIAVQTAMPVKLERVPTYTTYAVLPNGKAYALTDEDAKMCGSGCTLEERSGDSGLGMVSFDVVHVVKK